MSKIEALIFSRQMATIGAAVSIMIFLGCMNFSIGGRTYESVDGTFEQEGKVHLGPRKEQDVYYPVPYSHIPNLELSDDWHWCVIMEQKEDHFRVRNSGHFDTDVHWHAKGLRIEHLPPTIPPPSVADSPPSITVLPSQPLPAQ